MVGVIIFKFLSIMKGAFNVNEIRVLLLLLQGFNPSSDMFAPCEFVSPRGVLRITEIIIVVK
jgi:hypothetical protein